MYIDNSPFYDYDVAANCFDIPYILVIARMYCLADKVSPTWTVTRHIEITLENYLAILIGGKTAIIRTHITGEPDQFFILELSRNDIEVEL